MSDQAGELNRDQVSGTESAEDEQVKEEEISLDSMTKEQLLVYAEKVAVKVKPAMNKAEIIQAITDARGDADEGESPGAGTDDHPQDEGNISSGNEAPHPVDTDNPQIGTIRVLDGVELVKIGPGLWVPAVREKISPGKPVVIFSEKRAGKTIFAITGTPIVFDETGRATVNAEDGLYLRTLPGCSLEKGND
jgi:hypothetical protein